MQGESELELLHIGKQWLHSESVKYLLKAPNPGANVLLYYFILLLFFPPGALVLQAYSRWELSWIGLLMPGATRALGYFSATCTFFHRIYNILNICPIFGGTQGQIGWDLRFFLTEAILLLYDSMIFQITKCNFYASGALMHYSLLVSFLQLSGSWGFYAVKNL